MTPKQELEFREVLSAGDQVEINRMAELIKRDQPPDVLASIIYHYAVPYLAEAIGPEASELLGENGQLHESVASALGHRAALMGTALRVD